MGIQVQVLENASPSLGACIYVEAESHKLLLDCGLKKIVEEPIQFPFDPKAIEAVVLSHGHLGHCGLLPQLVADGFCGKIYCAAPTKDFAYLALLEASLVQSEGRQRLKDKKRILTSSDSIDLPFYSEEDVLQTQNYIHEIDYYESIRVGANVDVTLFSSGHIPGSSFMKIQAGDSQKKESILYITDLGSQNNDLYHPLILNESYGAVILPRLAKKDLAAENVRQKLCQIINETHQKEGNVIISAFSLDRRIEIMRMISTLIAERLIPHTLVFLDSPAARQISSYVKQGLSSEISCSGVYFLDSVVDSKCLTNISGTTVVICGSRATMPGRLQYHLKRNLPRANSSLVILGNPAEDGLYGQLLKRPKTISIEDKLIEVNASVYSISDPNFHADQEVITQWLSRIHIPSNTVVLTHGTEGNSLFEYSNIKFISPEPGEILTIP